MSELAVARRMLLTLTLASYLVMFGLARLAGLNIDYQSLIEPCSYFFGMLVVFGGYCHIREIRTLGYMIETVFCLLLLGAPVIVSTYIAMRLNLPLADEMLMRWDAMLGVDWAGIIAFVDDHAFFAELLRQSYQSFVYQLLALPPLLVLAGQAVRAFRMVIAYALIVFIAAFVSIGFPALGSYAFQGVTDADLASINIHFGYHFLSQFHAVRTDPDFVLSIADAAGIITFPSVHAAVAGLCIWASWSVRYLRYPMLMLNILMAVSAITHAGHYVVDILAGTVITFAVIALVKWLTGRAWARQADDAAAMYSPA
jgi:membrane-associated phospholipid phosphatase